MTPKSYEHVSFEIHLLVKVGKKNRFSFISRCILTDLLSSFVEFLVSCLLLLWRLFSAFNCYS